MKPEIHARLTIEGDFHPDEVTRRLGVEPRYTMRKGERRNPGNPRVSKTNVWSSAWSQGSPFEGESYVANLVDEFWERRQILRELVEEFGVALEVSVAIYIYERDDICETPSLHLDPTVMQRMVDLGAELDVDLYVIDGNDDDQDGDEKDGAVDPGTNTPVRTIL